MGLEHLIGRRTGRPKGVKSAPRWQRDVRWAYRNLGNPDAKPPTELAGRLLALAREHPDRFVACLAQLDTPAPEPDPDPKEANAGRAAGRCPCDEEARRLKRFVIGEDVFFEALTRSQDGSMYAYKPPYDAHIAAVEADVRQRGLNVILHSDAFGIVPDGEPVPEMRRTYTP